MSTSKQTVDTIRRFNDAFNAHDVDAVMALMTDDVVFENTSPPEGERHVGQAAVRRQWEALFSKNPQALFDGESEFAAGDRCVVQWRFVFDRTNPDGGSVRGVDVFRVRDGKVCEKSSYVKG